MVRILKKTLEQPGEDRGVHSMKSAMLDSLQKRFSDIEQTDFLVLSTMLDPRYKDKFFSSVNSRACAKDLLEDVHRFQDCEINLQEPALKRPATDNESKIWGCLNDILTESNASVDAGAVTEIDKYLIEPLIDFKKGDPYSWWKLSNVRYPVLSQLARRYLSAPPSNIPSEQLFSGAGGIYDVVLSLS